jgi:hypothetical protein
MHKLTSLRARLSALAAMAGGAAWVATGAIQLTGRDELRTGDIETALEHVLLGLMAAALLLTAPAVIALARHARTGRPAYLAAARTGWPWATCSASTGCDVASSCPPPRPDTSRQPARRSAT